MVTRALAADVREPAVLSAAGARLQFIHEYLTTEQTRAPFERWVREHFNPALDASRASVPETDTQRARRAALLGIVGAIGRDADVVADATQVVQAYLEGEGSERVPPELLDAYVGLAATVGHRALYERYQAHAERAPTPEERYRFLYALAAFRDEALVRRTIAYALSASVRAQDRPALLVHLLANPVPRPIAWRAIQQNWDTLEAGLGALAARRASSRAGRVLRSAGGGGGSCQHPVPGSERALAQALEEIAACAELAAAQQPTLLNALTEAR